MVDGFMAVIRLPAAGFFVGDTNLAMRSGHSLDIANASAPLFAIVALTVLALLLWLRERRVRYDQCMQALRRLEVERADFRLAGYHAQSCALCFERFPAEAPSIASAKDPPAAESAALKCGHVFHCLCLAKERHVDYPGLGQACSCPVCLSDGAAAVGVSSECVRGARRRLTMSDAEYHFRLQRVGQLYPEFVSSNMVKRWKAEHRSAPLVGDSAFLMGASSACRSARGLLLAVDDLPDEHYSGKLLPVWV